MAPRTRADIEAEIAAARTRLAGNVEDLITQVHPKAVKTRAVNDAKSFVASELNDARSRFVDDRGEVKWEKIAYGAAAVVGALIFIRLLKKLGSR